MSKYIVIGNWKMNPESEKEAKKLFLGITKLSSKMKQTDVVVVPSFVHIPFLNTSSKKISLGAQDVSYEDHGAFTGQVSVVQLQKLGVRFVIVGHSERRALGETSEMINRKTRAVLASKMTAVICIGEATHDAQGNYLAFLQNEIKVALGGVMKADLARVVIAYEPIWAIGKTAKDAMSPHILHETVLYIQKILMELYGKEVLTKVRIIYGGSVGAENAKELLQQGMVKGFLVGGASLSLETFGPILTIADSTK